MLDIFDNIQKALSKENIENALQFTIQNSIVQDAIIDAVQKRLRKKGEDVEGNKFATNIALQEGSTSGYASTNPKYGKNVDFIESGKFYNSFEVIAEKSFFHMAANFIKKDKTIYNNFSASYSKEIDFKNSVLNPNDKEMNEILRKEALPIFLSIFRDYFFNDMKV